LRRLAQRIVNEQRGYVAAPRSGHELVGASGAAALAAAEETNFDGKPHTVGFLFMPTSYGGPMRFWRRCLELTMWSHTMLKEKVDRTGAHVQQYRVAHSNATPFEWCRQHRGQHLYVTFYIHYIIIYNSQYYIYMRGIRSVDPQSSSGYMAILTME